MSKVQSVILPCALMGCLVVIWLGLIGSTGVSASWSAPVVEALAPASQPVGQSPSNLPSLAGPCNVSHQYPQSILRWCGLITRYANENGLTPNLVAAIMLQESGGNPLAYSSSGAMGLLQVMPRDGLAAGFICSGGPCFASRPTIAELQDPEYNISYGTHLLANLLTRNGGDLRAALRSYGPFDAGFSYADKVLAIYTRFN